MVWIMLIVGVIGYILYSFFRDRDQMLQYQVDMQGGMTKKYEYLIEQITNYPNAKVVKVTRDQIHIRASGQATATNFLITEKFNSVEIEWVGQMAILGTHKHKWTYAYNFSQEKMIQEIKEYIEWKSKQIFGNNF